MDRSGQRRRAHHGGRSSEGPRAGHVPGGGGEVRLVKIIVHCIFFGTLYSL